MTEETLFGLTRKYETRGQNSKYSRVQKALLDRAPAVGAVGAVGAAKIGYLVECGEIVTSIGIENKVGIYLNMF